MQEIGFVVLVLFALIIVTSLIIMLGWSLFIIPVFGYESLTFIQAFGFSLLASAFKPHNLKKNK